MSSIGRPLGLGQRLRRAIDWVVVAIAVSLLTLALVNLNSADGADWQGHLLGEQLQFIAIGTVALIGAAAIDYRILYRIAYPLYAIGASFVALVLLVGATTNNAQRWLDLGFLRFQPSELMKLLLIVALARYLHDLPRRARVMRSVAVPLLLAGVPAALVVSQPNLSTGIVLMLIAVTLLAITVLDSRGVLLIFTGSVVALTAGWRFFMADYQQKRIDVWLNPELHSEEAYQIIHARTAVANGGFFGRGVGQGTQSQLDFVVYKESDFAFAVFAEEWGFLGAALLLALFFSLVLWAINIASQAPDRFGALLCAGVGIIVFWHVVLNVGVVLQFFPNTGLPLPFFSHGGSNVLTTMLGLGVLMSVSRSRPWR